MVDKAAQKAMSHADCTGTYRETRYTWMQKLGWTRTWREQGVMDYRWITFIKGATSGCSQWGKIFLELLKHPIKNQCSFPKEETHRHHRVPMSAHRDSQIWLVWLLSIFCDSGSSPGEARNPSWKKNNVRQWNREGTPMSLFPSWDSSLKEALVGGRKSLTFSEVQSFDDALLLGTLIIEMRFSVTKNDWRTFESSTSAW